MQLYVRVLAGGLVSLLAAGAFAQDAKDAKPGDAAAKAKVGQAAPDFTLTDAAGKKHALADYKDKVVVLEWLNKECPWSLKAIPAVKEIRKKYADKGVVWLGVDSTAGRKAADDVEHAKDKELGFPILMDPDGAIGRLYGAKVTPHIFILNKGTLVYAGGLHNNQHGDKKDADVRAYVDDALGALLGGKAIPVAETTPWGCPVKYGKAEGKGEGPGGDKPAAEHKPAAKPTDEKK